MAENKKTKKAPAGKTKSKRPTIQEKKITALHKKIAELEARIEDVRTEREASREKNVRLLAEFDNYRRRTQEERARLLKYSNESIAISLLPILDDLQRTIDSTPVNKGEVNPVLDGVIMVKKNFDRLLKETGIEVFDCVGQPFDTELHEALMSRETDEVADNTILEVFENGYKYHDRILRHAKVIVSKAKKEEKS